MNTTSILKQSDATMSAQDPDPKIFAYDSKGEGTITKSSIQAFKTRTTLQPEQAIQILKLKLSKPGDSKEPLPRAIGKQFGVSEKAVREIWKGRTWLRDSMHLDPSLAALASRLRPPGRPRLMNDKIHRDHDSIELSEDRKDRISPKQSRCATIRARPK